MNDMRTPPPGTKCADCGCCEAKVYAGGDAICWACDAGSHPSGKIEPQAKQVEIPAIRLQPAEVKCEVRQEEPVKRGGAMKRTSEEIRAKILSEPATVSNREVGEKYGVRENTVWYIRKQAGIRSTAHRGWAKGPRPETKAPKPETKAAKAETERAPAHAIEKRAVQKAAAIEYKRRNGHAALAVEPDSARIRISVEIDERSADAYWQGLTLEQKAATIELQLQAVIDQRVAARA